MDSTDATPNNSNYRNIQEAFVDKVLRKLHNLRQQYENLSDDGQAAVQVCAALLLLYISLGGRFGLGGIMGSNNGGGGVGSGSDESAYDRFYSSGRGRYYSSQREDFDYYSHDSRSRGKRKRSSYSSHNHVDDFFVMALVSMLIAFAMKSAGVPMGNVPIWFGVRRFHRPRFAWW